MHSIILAFALVFFATQVDALVLCTTKRGVGSLRIREDCRKSEVKVDPAGVGLGGPAVYDSTGKKVGNIIGTENFTSRVLFMYEDESYRLSVKKNEIMNFTELFYQSNDCTGQAYVRDAAQISLYRRVIVSYPGRTLYIVPDAENPAPIQYESFRHPDLDNFECIISSAEALDLPATPIVDLDTLFIGPFKAR